MGRWPLYERVIRGRIKERPALRNDGDGGVLFTRGVPSSAAENEFFRDGQPCVVTGCNYPSGETRRKNVIAKIFNRR